MASALQMQVVTADTSLLGHLKLGPNTNCGATRVQAAGRQRGQWHLQSQQAVALGSEAVPAGSTEFHTALSWRWGAADELRVSAAIFASS